MIPAAQHVRFPGRDWSRPRAGGLGCAPLVGSSAVGLNREGARSVAEEGGGAPCNWHEASKSPSSCGAPAGCGKDVRSWALVAGGHLRIAEPSWNFSIR